MGWGYQKGWTYQQGLEHHRGRIVFPSEHHFLVELDISLLSQLTPYIAKVVTQFGQCTGTGLTLIISLSLLAFSGSCDWVYER